MFVINSLRTSIVNYYFWCVLDSMNVQFIHFSRQQCVREHNNANGHEQVAAKSFIKFFIFLLLYLSVIDEHIVLDSFKLKIVAFVTFNCRYNVCQLYLCVINISFCKLFFNFNFKSNYMFFVVYLQFLSCTHTISHSGTDKAWENNLI